MDKEINSEAQRNVLEIPRVSSNWEEFQPSPLCLRAKFWSRPPRGLQAPALGPPASPPTVTEPSGADRDRCVNVPPPALTTDRGGRRVCELRRAGPQDPSGFPTPRRAEPERWDSVSAKAVCLQLGAPQPLPERGGGAFSGGGSPSTRPPGGSRRTPSSRPRSRARASERRAARASAPPPGGGAGQGREQMAAITARALPRP